MLLYQARISRVESPVKPLGAMSELSTAVNGDPFSMAQGFARLSQERPDILAGIFRHPLLLGGGVVLAGLIAKHMIAHHERQQYEMYQQQHPQYNYPQGYGDPYAQGQIRHEEREIRREIRREEQELHRLEERDRGW